MNKVKLPTKKSIRELVSTVRRTMLENPPMYWDVEREEYVTELTIGVDGNSRKFGYQTGDNSYTGGAYGYKHWAVLTVTNNMTLKEIVDDVFNQWYELTSQ